MRDLAEEWSQIWGGPGIHDVKDLAMDTSGNILLTGIISLGGELFLLKYDKNGVLQWDIVIGSDFQDASLVTDSQDNVFVASSYWRDPNNIIKLFKYNSSGDLQ